MFRMSLVCHTQNAGHGAEREEDDGYGGESIDGCLAVVLVGVNLLDVL